MVVVPLGGKAHAGILAEARQLRQAEMEAHVNDPDYWKRGLSQELIQKLESGCYDRPFAQMGEE
jgi:hypothetical protein